MREADRQLMGAAVAYDYFPTGLLVVALWSWATAAALAIAIFLSDRLRRRRRRRQGCCLNCGYNLTGNVSGVCPECGEQI